MQNGEVKRIYLRQINNTEKNSTEARY